MLENDVAPKTDKIAFHKNLIKLLQPDVLYLKKKKESTCACFIWFLLLFLKKMYFKGSRLVTPCGLCYAELAAAPTFNWAFERR